MSCCNLGGGAGAYLDADIDRCMSVLRDLQSKVKADERYRRQHQNQGKNDEGNFHNLKSQIVGRLGTVRNLLDSADDQVRILCYGGKSQVDRSAQS